MMMTHRHMASIMGISFLASMKTTAPISGGVTVVGAMLAEADQIPGWAVTVLGLIGGAVVVTVGLMKGYRAISREGHSIAMQQLKQSREVLTQQLSAIKAAVDASATDLARKASDAASSGAKVGAEVGVQKTVKATLNGPLESMIRNCPHPMWIKEAVIEPSGQVRFVMRVINTAYCRRFGRAREHYEGFDDFEVWDNRLAKSYYENDMVVYTTGRPDEFREEIGETLDGVRSEYHGKNLSIAKWIVRYKDVVGVAGIMLPVVLDTDAV